MTAFAKVVVIDDDPVLRMMVQEYFERRGPCEVLHAGDGIEALRIVREHGSSIDLVLSDLNMPRLDGVELLNRLKEIAFQGPIIIVSGTVDVIITMAHELAAKHGLNIAGTIYKPFDPKKLDEIIAGL